MSLHLNLYHEVIKAKALKRRDPLKLTMYALSAVVAGFAGYYVLQAVKLHSLNSELATVKAEFDKLDPASKAAKAREVELSVKLKAGNLLVKKVENRFYWAPLLEQIMQVVPREVQVTRFVGDVSGEGPRRCALSIDGLSAGEDARNVAETLRTAIAEKISPQHKNVTSKFRMLEDGIEMAMLDGKQVPTATFAINVEFTSGEEPAPEPTRRKR